MVQSNAKAGEMEDTKKMSKTIKWLTVAVILLVLILVVSLAGLGASGNLRGKSSETESDSSKNEMIPAEPTLSPQQGKEEELITAAPQPTLPNNLKTMPNVGFLLSGYDILFGNPLPTSASGVLTSDPGFRSPVFVADYSEAQTTQDRRYLVPGGLAVRSCTGTCSLSFTSNIIESALQYQERLGVKAKVSASRKGLLVKARFSASVDYQRVESGTSSNGETVSQSEASCCAYFGELSAFDMPRFHPTFLAGLESLTDEYDEKVYQTFIDAFGTHYVQKGFMGALYGEQSMISEQARTSLESQNIDIRAAASASAFGISVSAKVQVEEDKTLAAQFRSEDIQRSVYTHGAAPPADGDPSTWASQTIESPAPISIELERLDSLPLPISEAAMANLEQALDTYCAMLVGEGQIGSCDGPSESEPEGPLANPDHCPVQANPFMMISCADWSKLEPLRCGDDCCYRNTCHAFQAGFNVNEDCVGRGDKETCAGFFPESEGSTASSPCSRSLVFCP